MNVLLITGHKRKHYLMITHVMLKQQMCCCYTQNIMATIN